jgi:hypothetical protein
MTWKSRTNVLRKVKRSRDSRPSLLELNEKTYIQDVIEEVVKPKTLSLLILDLSIHGWRMVSIRKGDGGGGVFDLHNTHK